jgi:hypothetical protein
VVARKGNGGVGNSPRCEGGGERGGEGCGIAPGWRWHFIGVGGRGTEAMKAGNGQRRGGVQWLSNFGVNHINITTPPEFRIKRIPCPGREEYKAIMEILSGPNVFS